MKLFSRKQQQPQPIIPPELQPYYNTGSHQKGMWRNRQVLLPVGILLLALIVIGIVVWQIIVLTSTHKPKTSTPQQATQSPQQNIPPSTSGTPAQTPSSGKTNSSTVPNPAE